MDLVITTPGQSTTPYAFGFSVLTLTLPNPSCRISSFATDQQNASNVR